MGGEDADVGAGDFEPRMVCACSRKRAAQSPSGMPFGPRSEANELERGLANDASAKRTRRKIRLADCARASSGQLNEPRSAARSTRASARFKSCKAMLSAEGTSRRSPGPAIADQII